MLTWRPYLEDLSDLEEGVWREWVDMVEGEGGGEEGDVVGSKGVGGVEDVGAREVEGVGQK